MLPTRLVAFLVLGLLGLVYQSSLLAIAADNDALPTIVIRIKNDGNDGKYIKDGATTDDPVEVVVGQKVKWINDAPNSTHTATADKNNPATDKPLFNTDDLTAGGTASMEILFDQALFTAAGGDGQKSVDVKYHCTHHGQMHGIINLKPAAN